MDSYEVIFEQGGSSVNVGDSDTRFGALRTSLICLICHRFHWLFSFVAPIEQQVTVPGQASADLYKKAGKSQR